MDKINFNIKNTMSNGAPEDDIRQLLKMTRSGNIVDLYASIKSYCISYDTNNVEFLDSQDKFFSSPPDFVIDGLLSEGAVVVENGENLQILTNAYSGFDISNIIDIIDKNENVFKKAQVMYIWVNALNN